MEKYWQSTDTDDDNDTDSNTDINTDTDLLWKLHVSITAAYTIAP